MRIHSRTILLALAVLALGCSKEESGGASSDRLITATVGSGPQIEVKPMTELGGDGISVRWSTGDKIALWAFNAEGEATLSGSEFALWHYNQEYGDAKFTAQIEPMAEGSYDYCALSPVPASVSGTTASYVIASEQNGRFDGRHDVMVATPVQGAGALQEGDNSEQVNFRFKHKVHVLKIDIASNALGEPVEALELTFPRAVVGTMNIDLRDAGAAPSLTGGAVKLTLRPEQAVDAGSTLVAIIAPADFTTEEEIRIKAISRNYESVEARMPGKSFAEGHTTPIRLHVPEADMSGTRLRFSLNGTGEETLGEPVQRFTLTAPEGMDLGDGSNTHTFTVGEEPCDLLLRELPEGISGAAFTVTFESENALLTRSFVMPQIIPFQTNVIPAFDIPYLLFEDFSSLNQTTGESDNPGVGGTDVVSGDRTGIDLSQWGLSTQGWTGSRIGVEAGGAGSANGAVRICARVENQQIASNTYNARLDSAPLGGIKEGKSPSVRVTYNYKGGRWSMKMRLSWVQLVDDGPGNGTAVYSYGYTDVQGFQAGSVTIPNLVESNVVLPATEGADRNQNQTYDGISYENSFVIPAATSLTRASWSVSSTMNDAPIFGANGNFWLYIDNVKVSIVH